MAPSPYAVHRATSPSTATSSRVRPAGRSAGAGPAARLGVRRARVRSVRPVRDIRRGRPLRGREGEERGPGEGGDREPEQREEQQVPGGGEVPRDERAEPGAEHPPRLNAAWKLGITGRRRAATRSTAALFMATLMEPNAAPKTTRTRPSASAERVSGGSTTPADSSAAVPTVTACAP